MANEEEYRELTDHLRELGHTDVEIVKILDRVRQYDREMRHDSLMDSIGNSSIDLTALIQEALAGSTQEQHP